MTHLETFVYGFAVGVVSLSILIVSVFSLA